VLVSSELFFAKLLHNFFFVFYLPYPVSYILAPFRLTINRFILPFLGIVEVAQVIGMLRKVAEAKLVQPPADGRISGRKISSGGHGVWVRWAENR
jgi:cytochrome b subunit of formate dehydrogenase